MADCIDNPSKVVEQLQLHGDTIPQSVIDVTDAVNALMADWFGDLASWTAAQVHGAVMLAARIHRRRNSPGGVESFGDLGPTYVQRNDPDVALLLGLGSYRPPQVG